MRTIIYQLHRTGRETVRQHFYCVLAVFCEHDDSVFRCKDKIVESSLKDPVKVRVRVNSNQILPSGKKSET